MPRSQGAMPPAVGTVAPDDVDDRGIRAGSERGAWVATVVGRGDLAMQTGPAEHGITLVEVLVAAAVLTVGMLAALSAMAVGFDGVEAAHRSSVALFLAEERLERVRGVVLGDPSGQGLSRLTPERFPAEPYGTIVSHPNYRRQTEVAIEPEGLRDIHLVRVTVFYRTVGGAETFERLTTVMALP